jgi:hypothetical protein
VTPVNIRKRIPELLLTVMGLLAAGFAVLAVSEVPNSADVTVHNATLQSYSSNSFTLDLIFTVSAGTGSGVLKQVREVVYRSPTYMQVSQISPTAKTYGQIQLNKVAGELKDYESVTAGKVSWVQHGSVFTRTEPLTSYINRTEPSQVSKGVSTVSGVAHETAIIHNGYLISVDVNAIVPNQTLAGGQQAAGARIGEVYQLVTVNGGPISKLG